MADARFMVNDAIEMLRKEADHRVLGLRADAIRLETQLLEAFAARDGATWDAANADIRHVFEAGFPWDIHTGSHLELMAMGQWMGRSLVAPTIKKGRYRATLLLTRLPDVEPRE